MRCHICDKEMPAYRRRDGICDTCRPKNELIIYAHVASEVMVREGTAQLMVSAKDYQAMRDFFRKHFVVAEFVENRVGETYCMRLPKIVENDE